MFKKKTGLVSLEKVLHNSKCCHLDIEMIKHNLQISLIFLAVGALWIMEKSVITIGLPAEFGIHVDFNVWCCGINKEINA